VYALYNADGKELSRATTGSNGAATFTDLVWGDYTVKEVHSPDGFLLNETEYAVSITRENCETVQSVKTTDEQATTVFSLTKYVALTTGVNTTTPLAGATFRLTYVTDSGQTDYGLFVTDKNGTIYMEDIPYGTYIVSEYRSPAGYIKCDNMTVTFSPSNRYVTLNLYDTRKSGQIIMVKMDDNNSLVEGAEYGLYTTSDTLVKQGVTDDAGTLYFTDLEWGDYYLAEITAPQGYELSATHYPVTIDGTNLVATVNVQDETIKGSVVLTKTDEKGNNTLAGAEYALYKTNGTLVSDGLVTDKNGTIRVNDLAWGSYYFQETSAPTGYTISTEPIRFSINAQNASIVQTLYATDKQDSRTVAVTKRIKADEINFANGNPTFLFQLSGKDVNGNSHTYTQLVTFDEEYVKENTTADGYVTQQAFFTDLLAGTYTLSEDDSARYVLESISGYGEAQKKGDTVVFDLTKYAYGEATFQNKVYEGQNYSHNDNVKNIVSTGAALTGLTVKYTGASRVEAESKVSPSTLIVTAYYDDGSSAILSSDEYELALSQYPNENGSYTNTVSYTYHGVTKSGTYTVTIYGQKERVTSLTVTYNGDEIFVNDTLSKSDFTVVANYNTGKTKTLSSTNTYLTMSPTTAPSEAGNFDVTFSYTEDSKTTTGTISLTAAQAIPWLATNTMSLIDDAIGGASTSFTLDFEPPFVYESAIAEDSVFTVIDVSEAGNNSVVAVVNYDSTSGYSIIICPTSGFRYAALPRDCSSFFANQSKMSFVATQYLDISYVTNMSHMFDHCTSLENIDALANWDTHNVTDMSDMFYYCYSLTELDVSGFDTSNVTNMSEMFYDCSSLTELDVSGFDTSNVTNMSEMFSWCFSLTELDVSGFDTSNVTTMLNMFYRCSSLTELDVSGFDTSNVTNMREIVTES
jgi:surface protein